MHKIGFIFLILGIFFSLGCIGEESQSTARQKHIIVDESRKIDAGSYWAKGFTATAGMPITVRMSVQEKDIDFYLIQGKREYEAYARGETFYHNSQYSKTNLQRVEFEFVIPEDDTYYFVLSNKGSLLTPKYVDLYIDAYY